MFRVTRYPMISKTESGRVSKEIPGSRSGSGTCWALFLRTGPPHLPILISWGKSGKNKIWRNFWLGGPIDPKPTLLNAFSGIPHSTIFCALKYAPQILYLAEVARIFERAKYVQMGHPWKDLEKCSSDALVLGQRTTQSKVTTKSYFCLISPI